MSERDTYPAGVPCWVTNLQHDVPAATAFYQELFGWEMESGPDDVAPYVLGRLRGRDVAAIGTMPGSDTPPAWVTEVRTDDLAATVAAVREAGGEVLQEEVDFSPVGKLGVFIDPAGATFCAWEGGDREGAQLVNEAERMVDERVADPRRRARGGLLQCGIRLGDRGVRPRDDVPAARLRRRRGVPARPARRGGGDDAGRVRMRRRPGAWTSGSTTSSARSTTYGDSAGPCSRTVRRATGVLTSGRGRPRRSGAQPEPAEVLRGPVGQRPDRRRYSMPARRSGAACGASCI